MSGISYKRHRFPPDVIRHAVWLGLFAAIGAILRRSDSNPPPMPENFATRGLDVADGDDLHLELGEAVTAARSRGAGVSEPEATAGVERIDEDLFGVTLFRHQPGRSSHTAKPIARNSTRPGIKGTART